MSSTCVTSIDICAIRVARVTEAGAPMTGAKNGYVSEAPFTLGVTVETEAGENLTQKNGCGRLIASLAEPDQISGLTLALEVCQLDAYLAEIMADCELFEDGGDAIGFQLPEIGAVPDPICFEAWSKAWEDDHQYVSDFTTPDATYIHWVFPYNRWVPGDFTLEHQLLVLPLNGKGQSNPSITANGPFNDWPVEVAGKGGVTRMGGWFFDNTLPVGDCDYVPVTSAAS
jgi:hypothetical protein